jgi:hypothetical protein
VAAAGGTDEGPDRLRQLRDTDLRERLRSRREREALSDEGEPNLDLAGAGENLTVRASLIENNDDLALERVLGHSDLLPIHWLQRGLNVARSVCRVAVRDQAGDARLWHWLNDRARPHADQQPCAVEPGARAKQPY